MVNRVCVYMCMVTSGANAEKLQRSYKAMVSHIISSPRAHASKVAECC